MQKSLMLRAQQQFITQDLAQKMVFLTGPRQVGKTYLAQEIAKGFQKSVYLNYDYFEDRDIIKNAGWLLDTQLLILDELQKMEGLKHLNAIEDYEGKRAELKYLRTKEKKEVDFALVVEDRPISLVETKLSDVTVSPTLKYFNRKYGFSAVQVIKNLRQERISDLVELRKGVNFLKTLKL